MSRGSGGSGVTRERAYLPRQKGEIKGGEIESLPTSEPNDSTMRTRSGCRFFNGVREGQSKRVQRDWMREDQVRKGRRGGGERQGRGALGGRLIDIFPSLT